MIFLKTLRMLTFFSFSLTKTESEMIARTLKRGIETEERIEAATTGFESPEQIDMASEIPMIA